MGRSNFFRKVLVFGLSFLLVGSGLISLALATQSNTRTKQNDLEFNTRSSLSTVSFNGPDQFVKNISLTSYGSRTGQVFLTEKYIYAQNWGGSYIVILNRNNHTIKGAIKGTGDNHNIVGIFEDQDIIYLSNYYGGSVTKATISTQNVIKTYSVCPWTQGRNNVLDQYFFVRKGAGTQSTGYIKKINSSNDQIVNSATLTRECEGFDISANKSYLYCPMRYYNNIAVLSTDDLHLMENIPFIDQPVNVRASPDGKYLWITYWNTNKISIMDLSNNSIIHNISNIVGDFYFSPDNKFIYITDSISQTIKILNNENFEIIKTIPIKFKAIGMIALSLDNSEMYVSDDQNTSLAYFINPRPDLSISTDDITFSNPNPAVNEEISISAKVSNKGKTSGSGEVKFWLGDPTQVGIWTKESGIRVDNWGTMTKIQQPDVIKLPNGSFRMYYSGGDGIHSNVHSAFSNDSINWERESGIRIPRGGTYDSWATFAGNTFQLSNGSYKMYYTGHRGGSNFILSAFSIDGLNWIKENKIILSRGATHDSWSLYSPIKLNLPNGTMRMYYTGEDNSYKTRILSAFSKDGNAWNKEPGIRINLGGIYDKEGAAHSEIVQLIDGSFRMYYKGYDGSTIQILSAHSNDGYNWVKENKLLLTGSNKPSKPDVIHLPNGNFRMYYNVLNGSNLQILSAKSSFPATQITPTKYISSLAPDTSTTISVKFTPTETKQYNFYVTIEDCSPADSNLSNNIANRSIEVSSELPDLSISSEDITFSNPNPDVGETISINAKVHKISGNGTSFENTWINMKTPSAPNVRYAHTMVSIPGDDKILMFGGRGEVYYNGTWLYDLSDNKWINMNPSKTPPARGSCVLSFDIDHKKVVMFGGAIWDYQVNNWKVFSDTWTYDIDSNIWTEMHPVTSPSARQDAGFVYDEEHRIHILFGGIKDSTANTKSDTWSYNLTSNTWTNLNPSTPPSNRYDFGIAYDIKNEKTIVFGGSNGWTELKGTFAFDYDINKWIHMNPIVEPNFRTGTWMVYDSVHGNIILISGHHGSSHPLYNDTWTYNYNNNSWVNMNPIPRPPLRCYHAMANIYNTSTVVLFGGSAPKHWYNDTWVYYYQVDVTTANVSFYDGDPGSGGKFIGRRSITIWNNYSPEASIDWNATEGYHNIYVKIENVVPGDVNLSNNIASKTLVVQPQLVVVTIDIKPGSDPNSINLGSKGKVPVAILTTEEFDASDIDPESVIFAGASPLKWKLKDVDKDGDKDLLLHFNTQDLDLDENSTIANLTGKTEEGTDFEGNDTVNIVPLDKDDDKDDDDKDNKNKDKDKDNNKEKDKNKNKKKKKK